MPVDNQKIKDIPSSKKSSYQRTTLSSQPLQQIVDTMNIAFAMRDKNGKTTYINKHFTKLFGYELKEVLGKPVLDFLDEENKVIFAKQSEKRKKGLDDPYEISVTCKNGQKHPVLMYPNPIFDKNGKFAGSSGVFIDILNRKLLETEMLLNQHSLEASLTDQIEKFANIKQRLDKSLKQARTRFSHITNTIKDVFWITDLDSQNVLYASPAYEGIWGNSVKSLYENPRQWIEAVIEQDRPKVYRALESISKTSTQGNTSENSNFDVEYRIKCPDGSIRWIRDRGYPVCDENGELLNLAGIAEDITARKEAEFELQEKRLQIQALSSEMASVEESERKHIAEGLHDSIIQPMVFLDIKLGSLAAEQKDEENIKSCKQIRQILAQLIDRTRTFTFDLSNPVLYELGLETALDEWLTTEVEAKHYLPVVLKTDGDIANLDAETSIFIFKAAKELTINIIKHAHAKSAFISVIRKDDSIELTVKDNGKGFNANDTSKMYADKKGLGLFSLKEKLIHLQGSMDIQSSPKEGTTVTINIPIKSDENDSAEQPG
jgi:PAS domain S-box-containing protein